MAEMEPIPLSAIRHAVSCLRQAGLIHLERLWAENRFTAEGDVLHAVADKGVTRRVVSLCLQRINLTVTADLVEFAPDGAGFPVEWKRGKPMLHRADAAQLCAGSDLGPQGPYPAPPASEREERVVLSVYLADP